MKQSNKDLIMERLDEALQNQAIRIQSDSSLSTYDKLDQMNVVIDVLHFLNDYDENVKVLNEYYRRKRQQERFSENSDDVEL